MLTAEVFVSTRCGLVFALLAPLSTVRAQTTYAPADLFAADWQKRNRAAAALAKGSADLAEPLLAILRGTAKGEYREVKETVQWNTAIGLGGTEEALLYRPNRFVFGRRYYAAVGFGDHVRTKRTVGTPANLWIPHGTRALATWVVARRLAERPAAKAAAMLEALKAKDGGQRHQAAHELARLGKAEWASIEQALSTRATGSVMARELSSIGRAGEQLLLRALKSASDNAKCAAIEHLSRSLHKELPATRRTLLGLFLEGSRKVSRAAAAHVQDFGREAVPFLQKALVSDSLSQRRRALGMLVLLGKDARPALPAVRPFLKGVGWRKMWAIQCLTRMELRGKEAISLQQRLLELGKDKAKLGVQAVVIEFLGSLDPGELDPAGLDYIVSVFSEVDVLRGLCIRSLQKLGRERSIPLKTLRKCLGEDDSSAYPGDKIREAMAAHGVKGLRALEKAMLDHAHERDCESTIAAFARAPAETLPRLLDLTRAKQPERRRAGLTGVVALRPKHRDTVSLLARMMQDRDPSVREHALDLARRTEQRAKRLAELLPELFFDNNQKVRVAALRCGPELEPKLASWSAPAVKCLEDKDEWIRSFATDVLVALASSGVGEDRKALFQRLCTHESPNVQSLAPAVVDDALAREPAVVDALLRLLESDARGVRSRAADALGKCVQHVDRVRPALQKLVQGNAGEVDEAARDALSQLRRAVHVRKGVKRK